MASTLQEIRKAAGYKNAKDFAEAMGLPVTTYSRYESVPEKIPTERAWAIADALNCTIDEVVGRQTPEQADNRGEVQREYDALSPEGRKLADEFRRFLAMRESERKHDLTAKKRRRYDALAYQYEHMMFEEREREGGFGFVIAFDSAAERRKAFEAFIRAKAKEKQDARPVKHKVLIEQDEQTIAGIMEAYDRAHEDDAIDRAAYTWAIVDLESSDIKAIEYDSSESHEEGGGSTTE